MNEYQQPDFTKPIVVLPNTYRLGDSVALLTLMSWLDTAYGIRHRYILLGAHSLSLLLPHIDSPPDVVAVADESVIVQLEKDEDAGRVSVYNDNGHLWMWNDYFAKTEYRLKLNPIATDRSYRAVFAPLVEADYNQERCLRLPFVRNVARILHNRFGDDLVILRPSEETYHAWAGFHGLARQGYTCLNAPMTEVIRLVAAADLVVGCDTGIAHVAGMMSDVAQIALHDKKNLEHHNERWSFDGDGHKGIARQRVIDNILAATAPNIARDESLLASLEYRSVPNKHSDQLGVILFDDGGDEQSLRRTVSLVNQFC